MNGQMMRTGFFNVVRQSGFTLTELMVALVLGALVVLAGTSMVVTSRATYRTQDEATRVQESSRFALELMNRLVRLAGYTNFGDLSDGNFPPAAYLQDPTWIGTTTAATYAINGPNLVGANNSKLTTGASINGSDSVTIRFYGSGPAGAVGDGNVLDCAGNAIAAPVASQATYSTSRAYNVLFVDTDSDGEPALMCRRQTYDSAGTPSGLPGQTQALIRGVESFQVLFGEAIYAVGADPDSAAPVTIVYRSGVGGPNAVLNWNNVVTVRIAMLIRSNLGASVDTTSITYNLFGASYPGGSDPGTQFSTAALSVSERTRIRRVVETTVFVRNRVSSWPSLN